MTVTVTTTVDGVDVTRFVKIMGSGDPSLALFKAAKNGSTELINALVSLGAELDFANPAFHGYTPLMIASQKGHDMVVRQLVELGSDVRATGVKGETALHEACFEKHQLVALYLLRHGADPNSLTQYRKTPLDFAETRGFASALTNAQADASAVDTTVRRLQGLRRSVAQLFVEGVLRKAELRRVYSLAEREHGRSQCFETECTELRARAVAAETAQLKSTEALESSQVEVAALREELERTKKRLWDKIKMGGTKRRMAERKVVEVTRQREDVELLLCEAEVQKKDLAEKLRRLDDYIQDSIRIVARKNKLRGDRKQTSPRTVKLRTLQRRLADTEEREFKAFTEQEELREKLVEAEKAANAARVEVETLRNSKPSKANFDGRVVEDSEDAAARTIQARVRKHGGGRRGGLGSRGGRGGSRTGEKNLPSKEEAAACKIQARVRGQQARRGRCHGGLRRGRGGGRRGGLGSRGGRGGSGAGEKNLPSKEEAAACKIQARVRGQQARRGRCHGGTSMSGGNPSSIVSNINVTTAPPSANESEGVAIVATVRAS